MKLFLIGVFIFALLSLAYLRWSWYKVITKPKRMAKMDKNQTPEQSAVADKSLPGPDQIKTREEYERWLGV